MKRYLSSHRTSQGFTLVELLGVMVIILMLAGLLYPTMKSVRDQAKIAKAHADMDSLKMALRAYYQEYGRWPDTNNIDPFRFDTMLNGNYDVVTGALWLPIYGDPYYENNNPRRIKFMEFNKASIIQTGGEQGYFVDPWGKTYNILLDNGQGSIGGLGNAWNDPVAEDGQIPNPNPGGRVIPSPIAIYSYGPDKANNSGTGDDVISW